MNCCHLKPYCLKLKTFIAHDLKEQDPNGPPPHLISQDNWICEDRQETIQWRGKDDEDFKLLSQNEFQGNIKQQRLFHDARF